MPIYPYICNACGHEFDQLQKIGDEPLRQCPQCREETLRKKLTAPSFRLKGTGWYETDFKDKQAKKDGDKEGDKTKDKADDTKPAAKDDKKSAGKKADSKSSTAATSSDSNPSKPSTSKSADST